MPERLPTLSFFFPAYNEEHHVEAIVASALATLPRFADAFEVIVIDDGSRDRTGELADALAARHSGVRVIHHRPNRGYGGALRSGITASTKEYVFFTDGDGQFDVADLGLLIASLDGVDAVIGYRRRRSDPWRRLFLGWVYNRLIGLLFGGGWRDVDCAFKLFRREVFGRVPVSRIRSDGAFFSAELLINLRAARVAMREVAVPHHPRTAGMPTGGSPKVILRAIRDLLRLRLALWWRGSAYEEAPH